MQTTSPVITRFFRVARRDLVYLKFILEAYEGLSTLTTVEKREAIVRVTYGAEFHRVMEELLQALGEEISLAETPAPHEGDHEHA